jgi:hypothetical protein
MPAAPLGGHRRHGVSAVRIFFFWRGQASGRIIIDGSVLKRKCWWDNGAISGIGVRYCIEM